MPRKNTVPKILRESKGSLKQVLLRDAPDRYEELKYLVGRMFRIAQDARWVDEYPAGGGEPLKANCDLVEAMGLTEKAANALFRLVEHNTGRPSESKEVKEERKLIIEIPGFDPMTFKLAGAVVDAEVKEMVGEGGDDAP